MDHPLVLQFLKKEHNLTKTRHLVLIGLNFQNKKSSGDKNFWVDLIPLLARRLQRITIYSIREHIVKTEEDSINGCKIVINYLSPTFLETPDSLKKRKIFWKQGYFPSWLGVLEKMLSLKGVMRELLSLMKKTPYQHIHLMDNLGIANRLVVKFTKVPVTVSAMAYQGKTPIFIYNLYLKLSYCISGIKVVPYNEVFQKKLLEIGMNQQNLCTIPWGVYKNESLVSDGEKIAIKRNLGIVANVPLILWAGYIQQIGREDFLYAYKIAKKALDGGLKATFFFAFKPETFEKKFLEFAHTDGIIIKPTNKNEFQDLKSSCNVFFSPSVNRQCILAPPLTWIEMLNSGVPIVTTPVPGTEDIVIPGKTGFLSWRPEKLIECLCLATTEYSIMRRDCIEMVNNNFNIENSADSYLKLFNSEL